jgi:hypothetical protein
MHFGSESVTICGQPLFLVIEIHSFVPHPLISFIDSIQHRLLLALSTGRDSLPLRSNALVMFGFVKRRRALKRKIPSLRVGQVVDLEIDISRFPNVRQP